MLYDGRPRDAFAVLQQVWELAQQLGEEGHGMVRDLPFGSDGRRVLVGVLQQISTVLHSLVAILQHGFQVWASFGVQNLHQ